MAAPLQEIRLFVLDMDGTVYLGDTPFACTNPFLQRLRETGREYVFVTNNSSKDRLAYLEKLGRLGIPADARRLLTSGDACLDYLAAHHPGKKVFLVGTNALRRSFLEAGIPLADAANAEVAVVGFDTELDYGKLSGLYRAVASGLPYICTHPDLVCPAEGGAMPDIGATIAYIRALTGREPDVTVGKPEPYLLLAAKERFGVETDRIAVVGDRLYTDIEMARRSGAAAVLVLSGETKAEQIAESRVKPDYVFQDLSGMLPFLT